MTSHSPSDFGSPSRYVQAVPIYLKSDLEVARYFKECRDEIDEITGKNISVLVAQEITDSNVAGVTGVINIGNRFPGLLFADLPCLWLEDEFNHHTILKLPRDYASINQLLRILADVSKTTKNALAVAELVRTQLKKDAIDRSPSDAAIMEGLMKKPTERRVALTFGVIFVSAILVVAIFIPSPTAFQYTVFRIVLALAAAGFVSMTPGFIQAQIGTSLRAGGALAVFLIVYFYSPAALQALNIEH